MVTAAAEVVAARVTSGAKTRLGKVNGRGDSRGPTSGSSSWSCRRKDSCGWNCGFLRGRGGDTRREEANSAAMVDFESETFAHSFEVDVVRGLDGVDGRGLSVFGVTSGGSNEWKSPD